MTENLMLAIREETTRETVREFIRAAVRVAEDAGYTLSFSEGVGEFSFIQQDKPAQGKRDNLDVLAESLLSEEAAASVALDKDPHCHTICAAGTGSEQPLPVAHAMEPGKTDVVPPGMKRCKICRGIKKRLMTAPPHTGMCFGCSGVGLGKKKKLKPEASTPAPARPAPLDSSTPAGEKLCKNCEALPR